MIYEDRGQVEIEMSEILNSSDKKFIENAEECLKRKDKGEADANAEEQIVGCDLEESLTSDMDLEEKLHRREEVTAGISPVINIASYNDGDVENWKGTDN